MFENLLLAREGAVAVLTVNRPQVLDALNLATLDESRRGVYVLAGASRGLDG
jgi:enoyl-CoA hydratase/carnithine racemase